MSSAPILLPIVNQPSRESTRDRGDRLEILTALINAPSFDEHLRGIEIHLPPDHPVYGWGCDVEACEGGGQRSHGLCRIHEKEWFEARDAGISRADFQARARPVTNSRQDADPGVCEICPGRPARFPDSGLCSRHLDQWQRYTSTVGTGLSRERWRAAQEVYEGYGDCIVEPCHTLAFNPVGLCRAHYAKYRRDGRPGNARMPTGWSDHEHQSRESLCDAPRDFYAWTTKQYAAYRRGTINLIGLAPLLVAELRWSLDNHAKQRSRTDWNCQRIQHFVNVCRAAQIEKFDDIAAGTPGRARFDQVSKTKYLSMIITETIAALRPVYFTISETKEAGFIETDHFGRRFGDSRSHIDLRAVTQRWLRDLLWEDLARTMRSHNCPRSRGPIDNVRRSAIELSAFLEIDAPEGGHNATVLDDRHAQRFIADIRNRARRELPSLGLRTSTGKPSTVTEVSLSFTLNAIRRVMRRALEEGYTEQIGLNPSFVMALPNAGPNVTRRRAPFSDQMAAALSDEANLRRLADEFDPRDTGIRDVWEAILCTGRRSSEVLNLRLNAAAMHGGLPYLWHDQTKVGNLDAAIRIPERLYDTLQRRRVLSIEKFEHRYGRLPTRSEESAMALFPRSVANDHGERAITYGNFSQKFRRWVDSLDMGPAVAHQARHTIATNLLRAGANLSHIRRFLGHVSDRMAEHYVKVSNSDLEDVLQTVWVSGPASEMPGRLLSGGTRPVTREEAIAASVDLSRSSTPTEGGFCTYQPVVQGKSCPRSLDCDNCDKFVLSGADLQYWRRKQEQWRSIAERAPDDATTTYLHKVFEPTAEAIRGLESALSALGLLEEALGMDMRRPQDYFSRIWSLNFRAVELADLGATEPTRDATSEERDVDEH